MVVVITLGVRAVARAGAMTRKNHVTVIAHETIVNLRTGAERSSVKCPDTTRDILSQHYGESLTFHTYKCPAFTYVQETIVIHELSTHPLDRSPARLDRERSATTIGNIDDPP